MYNVIELVIAKEQQGLQNVSVRGPSSAVMTNYTTHVGILNTLFD